MSKNKKPQLASVPQPQAPAPRPSAEITQEYTNLCAELGNAVFNFEVVKSKAIARYMALNDEMQRAVAAEAKVKADGEKIMQQLAEKVVK